MTTTPETHLAPPGSGCLSLGQTLPSLLDRACDRYPNAQALNQWQNRRWQPLSNTDFRTAVEEFSLGLLALGLQRGDRVALIMHSDLSFCIADLGSLLAGLVNVPIDLTQTIENIAFILEHAAAKTLVISNQDLLFQVMPYLTEVQSLQQVVVADVPANWEQVRLELMKQWGEGIQPTNEALNEALNEAPDEPLLNPSETCLYIPQLLTEPHSEPSSLRSLPQGVQLLSLNNVQEQGRSQWTAERVNQLRAAIAPQDLATILYIASETKRPKGVMLTHENISANVLAAFSSYPGLETGDQEVALLFLPLTHIFARVFLYGHLTYGHSIYFSDPNHMIRHLKTVKPTILITVPRLLEKVYERILDHGQQLKPFDRAVLFWSIKIGQRYAIGQDFSKLYRFRLRVADRLVFAKWRSVFGDRLKALICGGAALNPDLARLFSAAGIPVLQGYGLTETSGVLCYNREPYNRPDTVGIPIAGVELTLAEDKEILVKSPFVMQGYYRDRQATEQAITPEGWLHTGDLGEISSDGFLKITGVKKSLFKLSTGKYVSPLPLEQTLNQSPFVAHAVTVGANQKFCGMLIFPNLDKLQAEATNLGLEPFDYSSKNQFHNLVLQHPCVIALYQSLIDAANCHLPYWSTVRKFKLVAAPVTIENGLLHSDGTIDRRQVLAQFASEIESLYRRTPEPSKARARAIWNRKLKRQQQAELSELPIACPAVEVSPCPVYAKSLTQH
ncbi:MAG: AMP-dependent synthetase/ligase [Elainellaceae cyanobacterium]